jgi:hypothetical protein
MHSILSLKSTVSVLVDIEKKTSKVIYYDLVKSILTKDTYFGSGVFYWLNSNGGMVFLKTNETNLTFAEFNDLDSTTPSGTALNSYVASVKVVQESVIKNGSFYGLAANKWVINEH